MNLPNILESRRRTITEFYQPPKMLSQEQLEFVPQNISLGTSVTFMGRPQDFTSVIRVTEDSYVFVWDSVMELSYDQVCEQYGGDHFRLVTIPVFAKPSFSTITLRKILEKGPSWKRLSSILEMTPIPCWKRLSRHLYLTFVQIFIIL